MIRETRSASPRPPVPMDRDESHADRPAEAEAIAHAQARFIERNEPANIAANLFFAACVAVLFWQGRQMAGVFVWVSAISVVMVYGFVKQSGGFIALDSVARKGTRISLYFPRSFYDEIELDTAVKDEFPVKGNGERILVVEDEDDIRIAACNHLTALGYESLEAENVDKALKILKADPCIDVLFSDIVLPGGESGVALARKVREMRPEIGILFTSGYAECAAEIVEGSESLGPMLSKPYSRAQLARKLRNVLGGRPEKPPASL